MMLFIFAIRDSAVEAYNPPFFARARGEAERMFDDHVNDRRSPLSKHPEFYSLHYLGQYDDKTGKMILLDHPEFQCKALDVFKKDEKPGGYETPLL